MSSKRNLPASLLFKTLTLGLIILNASCSSKKGVAATGRKNDSSNSRSNSSVVITTPSNQSRIGLSTSSASFTILGTCTSPNQSLLTNQTVTIKIDGTTDVTGTCDSNGEFSSIMDTTAMSEGAHTLVAKIIDTAGEESTSSTANFQLDLTQPTVSIGTPSSSLISSAATVSFDLNFADSNLGTLNANTINSGILIHGNATDCTKTTTVNGSVATVHITGCSISDGTASISVQTSAWADLAGNTVIASGPSNSFSINNVIPLLAITSPQTSSWISLASNSATFPISGTCTKTDQTLLTGRTVTISVDGSVAGSGTCNSSGVFTATIDTMALSSASHTLQASVTDQVGNTATATAITVTKDVTSPTVAITGPTGVNPANAADSTVYELTFSDVNASTLNATQITQAIQINGDNSGCSPSTTVNGLNATVTITGCNANGTVSISVGTGAWSDLAGNALTAAGPSSSFNVQNSGPALSISNPANLSWINLSNNSASFSVSGTCTAASQSQVTGQTVSFTVDGNSAGSALCTFGGLFSGIIDTTGLAAGSHTIVASLTDLGSNTSTASKSVSKDVTAPTVSISNPSVASVNASSTTAYTLTFSDTNLTSLSASTIDASITLNGATTGCSKSVTIASSTTATVSISGCSGSGTASISVGTGALSDLAGNSLTAAGPSATFTINNSLPNIAVTSPTANAWVSIASNSATYAISGTCTSSDQSQLTGQTVDLKVDGASAGSATCTAGGTFSGSVDSTTWSEGAHTLSASVTDLASNAANSSTVSVTKDAVAPTLSIGNPAGGGPAVYLLTFTDTNLSTLNATTINNAITITGSDTAGCTKSTTVSDATATVTISNCTGTSAIGFTVSAVAVSDLAGNTMAASVNATPFTPTAPSLTVTAYYSIAPNWNDYAKTADTTLACPIGGTDACIHGGPVRKVTTTYNSCSGLTMSDALGVFDWTCAVEGGFAVFKSALKSNKSLKDLLTVSGWKSNSVSLTGSGSGTSVASNSWWTNAITALPDNSSTSSAGNWSSKLLGTASTIYVLDTSRNTYGYNITADKVGVVLMSGVTLTWFASASNNINTSGTTSSPNTKAILGLGSRNFVWVEGTFSPGTTAPNNILYLVNPYNSYFGSITSSTSSTLTNLNLSGGSYNTFNNMTLTGSTGNSLIVSNTGKANTFSNLNVRNGGIYLNAVGSAQKFINVNVRPSPTGGYTGGYAIYVQGAMVNGSFDNLAISDATNGLYFASGAVTGTTISRSKFNNIASFALSFNGSSMYNSVVSSIFSNVANVISDGGGSNIYVGNTLSNVSGTIMVMGSNSIIHNGVTINTPTGTANPDISITTASKVTISQQAFSNFGYAINVGSGSGGNKFTGNMLFGPLQTSGSANCRMVSTGTNPGITDINCSNQGASDANYVTNLTNLPSSFLGKVTSDSSNASPGIASGVLAYSSISDWFNFANFFRTWGKSGSAFPNTDHYGSCALGNCQIWDWSLAAASSIIRNTTGNGSTQNGTFTAGAACPSEANGANFLTSVAFANASANSFALNGISPSNNNGACIAPVSVSSRNNGDYFYTTNPHGLSVGQKVVFISGGTVYGFSLNTTYYVVSTASTTQFQLSTSAGGIPINLNGDSTGMTMASPDCTQKFLKSAIEIVGPGTTGDQDGLCESNESCLYTPNFGAYQGHGTLGTCNYTAGTGPSDVTMYGYGTNGR